MSKKISIYKIFVCILVGCIFAAPLIFLIYHFPILTSRVNQNWTAIIVGSIAFFTGYSIVLFHLKDGGLVKAPKEDLLTAKWMKEVNFDKYTMKVEPNREDCATWTIADNYQFLAEDIKVLKNRLNDDKYSNKIGGNSIVFGASRSGKSSNVLLPSLFHSIKGSVKPTLICTDPKGELASLTKNFAKKNGYKVIHFTKGKDSWNPMEELWEMFHSKNVNYGDIDTEIKIMSDILVKAPIDAGSNTYFYDKAKSIVKGWLWLLLELNLTKEKTNLNWLTKEIIKEYTSENYAWVLELDKETGAGLRVSKDAYCRPYLSELLKKADTGIQAAISTAINGFDKFLSPSIKDMTSSSSFTTNDIVKTPCILYIGFDEDAPELASLLLDINYKRMNEYLNKREKLNFDRPIHYILEEFGNLPKLDFVPKAFSRDAGKNVSCMLILQSKAQLEEIYGRNKTKELLDSTRVLIILSIAGNVEFADELSQRSGKVIRETTSKSKSKDDKDSKGSESTSDSVTLRVDRSSFLNQKVLKEIIVILQGKPAFKFDTKLWWETSYSKEMEVENAI